MPYSYKIVDRPQCLKIPKKSYFGNVFCERIDTFRFEFSHRKSTIILKNETFLRDFQTLCSKLSRKFSFMKIYKCDVYHMMYITIITAIGHSLVRNRQNAKLLNCINQK